MGSKTIYIDESGNFGSDGRYFTIAAVELDSKHKKHLNHRMKNITRMVKENYPNVANENGEIKANRSNCIIREFVLRKVQTALFNIRYITVDLTQISKRLLNNQNVLYNYLASFLIKPLVLSDSEIESIEIILDERTKAVRNGFDINGYFQNLIWIDMKREEIDLKIISAKSHTTYGIQVADFIVHAIQNKFEDGIDSHALQIKNRIVTRQNFPYKTFGK
ncbi:DUF3800 domain-containing protein [Weissella paramesenteroides]|uniref:DUF3800 domain-containing protein n=1 Tax=Weissella paramesenteroides TaxID=1249 RepID=UPI0012390009|nr:DUF3800 domain-containing protein [Weissella paramesenteroides]KAA8455233.1 DUF3800 domain-containing protein [Weissella paramesenteroides]KAA8456307.1 DUF3800 domain-containing protein [Weissella paramesenteroides]KAA8458203.1 DUF3800 domain-containing protein [Weissella paramesenteroides]KAA8460194.1 DUF3800 domain-containing protein [Weissella paramesenteroides]KAA8461536.1 DUF3800 domain-containing protein [Weissella paramesenteroides]